MYKLYSIKNEKNKNQSATTNADTTLGRSINLITENMEANFIILNDNPLENLSLTQPTKNKIV